MKNAATIPSTKRPTWKAEWAGQCVTKVRSLSVPGDTLESQDGPSQVASGRGQVGLAVRQPEGAPVYEVPLQPGRQQRGARTTQRPRNTRHSECLEGDLEENPQEPQREFTAHLGPMAPGLLWWLSALCLVITFPQGWLQAILPNFLCRGCQVLAHCCIVREVRKTARSLQGLFPSSASWPNLQEKQQRAAGKALLSRSLSLILPLSLSLPVKKEAIQSLSLTATGV